MNILEIDFSKIDTTDRQTPQQKAECDTYEEWEKSLSPEEILDLRERFRHAWPE